MFANAYPKTSEPYLSLRKAMDMLATAKDKADDLFWKENPQSKRTHIYHGHKPADND